MHEDRNDERSANQTNQDQHSKDGQTGRQGQPAVRQGQPAVGQGQHGEEYGVYGRGATEGGRYADAGDSVQGATPQPAAPNPSAQTPPEPQRNSAQQEIARKQGQEDVAEHARPVNEAVEAHRGSTLHTVDPNRPHEGRSALDLQQESEQALAPRESTWKQNSGAETIFGGRAPEGQEGAGEEKPTA